jgi:hypothetical protein
MSVYFIQDEGGDIKIGFSEENPHRRLRTFRTGNPRELTLLVTIPGGAAEEKALHERFKDLRGRGEWFKPDPRLLGFIEALTYAYREQQPLPEEDSIALVSNEQLQAIWGYIQSNLLVRDGLALLDFVIIDPMTNEVTNVVSSWAAGHAERLRRLSSYALKIAHCRTAYAEGIRMSCLASLEGVRDDMDSILAAYNKQNDRLCDPGAEPH